MHKFCRALPHRITCIVYNVYIYLFITCTDRGIVTVERLSSLCAHTGHVTKAAVRRKHGKVRERAARNLKGS